MTNPYISSLAVLSGSVFAGTPDGIFRTTNDGLSWVQTGNGWSNGSVTKLLVSGSVLFAGTRSAGIFMSTDEGAHWTNISVGLPFPDIRTMCVAGGYLFAGVSSTSDGGGVWQRPLLELITDVAASAQVPAPQFVLSHNYPNPFSNNTRVIVDTKKANGRMLECSVTDILGNDATGLVTLNKYEGCVECNGLQLPAGEYVLVIRDGKNMVRARMQKIK